MFTKSKLVTMVAAIAFGSALSVSVAFAAPENITAETQCRVTPDVADQIAAGKTLEELLKANVCISDMLGAGVSAADLIAAGADPDQVLAATAAGLVPGGGGAPANLGGIGGGAVGGGAGAASAS